MAESAPASGFVLSNKLYDPLKFLALVLLPGLGTLYLALSGIWGLPNGEQVVGTITAIDLALGGILHVSSSNFAGDVGPGTPVGKFVVTELGDGRKNVKMELSQDPATFLDNQVISFTLAHELSEPVPPVSSQEDRG